MLLLFQAVCMVIMVTVLERIGRKQAECRESLNISKARENEDDETIGY
jgi:hypothetical protein